MLLKFDNRKDIDPECHGLFEIYVQFYLLNNRLLILSNLIKNNI
jgi:hypothetical protein